MTEVELGKVTHYFGKIGVAAIEITQDVLLLGDTVRIKGHTSDFLQKIESMQIDGQAVDEATIGMNVAFMLCEHAGEHDVVYKVVE